ncbi:MAG: ATP-binding protein, partial [Gemmatimonas sp.]
GEDTAALARTFVRRGYVATLTCVDTQQLDGAFTGRRSDDALLDALPAAVDPCGERGEFHSCVTDGPLFAQPIAVVPGERVLRDERFQYCDLVELGPERSGSAASGA